MEIRLSQPNPSFEIALAHAAKAAGCYARVKWATSHQMRFELVDAPLSREQAPFATQSRVIRVLLHVDPRAIIRSAKATYNGLADFEKQTAPCEACER